METPEKDDEQNIYKKYTQQELQMACKAVQNGMSYSIACKMYKIPQATLKYRAKKALAVQLQEKKPVIKVYNKKYQDVSMVKALHALADAGFTIANKLIRIFGAEYGKANIDRFPGDNPFRAELQWVPLFLKRHAGLAQRMSENRIPYGSDPMAPERMVAWFEFVTRYLEKKCLLYLLQKPRQLFTIDDMILKRSSKDVTFTCFFGANAYGNLLPPLVLYPDAIKIPTQKRQSELKYVVANPDTELTAENALYQWLSRVFQPWLLEENVPRPVILFVDGHRYQIGYLSSHFCKQHQIVLVALLPRSANMLRPLNAKLFEPIEKLWHDNVENDDKQLSSTDPPLLKPILDKLTDVESIIRIGFYQSKMYPWNSDDSQPPLIIRKDTANPPADFGLVQFQKMLESRMTEQELAEFQAHRHDEVWQGSVEYTSLFKVWHDSLQEAGASTVSLAGMKMNSEEDKEECLLDFVKEEPMVGYDDMQYAVLNI